MSTMSNERGVAVATAAGVTTTLIAVDVAIQLLAAKLGCAPEAFSSFLEQVSDRGAAGVRSCSVVPLVPGMMDAHWQSSSATLFGLGDSALGGFSGQLFALILLVALWPVLHFLLQKRRSVCEGDALFCGVAVAGLLLEAVPRLLAGGTRGVYWSSGELSWALADMLISGTLVWILVRTIAVFRFDRIRKRHAPSRHPSATRKLSPSI